MGLTTKKARQRLRQAKKAAGDLRFAQNYDEFEDAWLNFLLHAKGVYVQLGAACKGSPRAMQWLGAKKTERRNDPLLQYIYQSRDFAEHDPSSGARLDPGYLAIGKSAPGMSSAIRLDGSFEGGMKVTSLDGKPVLIESRPSTVQLLPVTGRGNVVFEPPKEHLGEPIKEQTPPVIADLCTAYLTSIVEEAESNFS